MPEFPVYFLAWTTYGTWLHGDPRGSTDDDHNQRNTPYLPHQLNRNRSRDASLKESPMRLHKEAREKARSTVVRVAHKREWFIHALNVRSNHVHLVIHATAHAPEQVMSQLKSWCSRDLKELDRYKHRHRFWTKMGSTRWINDEASLIAAIDYVLNHQ